MRRLFSRRLRADDGMTLIETVTALLVFALFATALGGGMVLLTHASAVTKVRNSATAVAQQQVEQARALGVTNLTVCTGGGSPSTYTPSGMSTSYNVLTGSSPCLTFQQTISNGGYTFTVKQYVLTDKTYDPGSGLQPQIEKLIAVNVAWSSPFKGSYELDSTDSGNGTITAAATTGVIFNIDDDSTSPAALVTDTNLVWDYTITDSTGTLVTSGSTADGTSGELSIDAGTYTCQVTAETDAASSYTADSANNAGDTVDVPDAIISGPCTVTDGSFTTWTTNWSPVSSCVSSGTKGTLQVYVTDQSGNLISGATVTLANVNGNGGTPGAVKSNSSGIANFNKNVPDDLYTYTITDSGYQTASALGPVCVSGNGVTRANGSITLLTTCASTTTKGSVTVTVVDQSNVPVQGAQVSLTNMNGGASPASTATNSSGVATFSGNVNGDSYDYTVSKTNYTSPGPQGPICVVASTTTALTAVLPVQGSDGCVSSSTKGTLVVTVTDSSGNPVNAVNITLTNANGHSGTPGAQKTNASGVATFNANVPGDDYYYTLSPPAGYTNYGTLGPVCIVGGQTTNVTASLQGVMSVKVTISNKDVQPTKIYQVTLTDSNNNQTSNSVTVNENKSGSVTFSNMPTDSNYSLSVCAQITVTSNCDVITSTTGNSFSKINTIYSVAVTDVKGGA